MVTPRVGFVVYGVHKDGLKDPLGAPFIDGKVVASAKKALRAAGLELLEHETVVASKAESRECFGRLAKVDDLDAVVRLRSQAVAARGVQAAHPGGVRAPLTVRGFRHNPHP
jgi:hypothetical protein